MILSCGGPCAAHDKYDINHIDRPCILSRAASSKADNNDYSRYFVWWLWHPTLAFIAQKLPQAVLAPDG